MQSLGHLARRHDCHNPAPSTQFMSCRPPVHTGAPTPSAHPPLWTSVSCGPSDAVVLPTLTPEPSLPLYVWLWPVCLGQLSPDGPGAADQLWPRRTSASDTSGCNSTFPVRTEPLWGAGSLLEYSASPTVFSNQTYWSLHPDARPACPLARWIFF